MRRRERGTDCLRQSLDRFGGKDVWHEAHASDVRAGMRKAADQASLHGIGYPHDDDRDRVSGVLRGLGGRRVHGHNNVGFEAEELGDQRREAIASAFTIPYIEDDALALDVPEPLELISKCLQQARLYVLGENAHARHGTSWLRDSLERPNEDCSAG